MSQFVTVYYTHKPGGFCKRLYRLCNVLVERGEEVVFYTLDPDSHSLDERVLKKKIPFPLEERSGGLFWFLFSCWAPLFFLFQGGLKRSHTFVFNPYYWAILAPVRALKRVASVTTFFRSVGSRTYFANGIFGVGVVAWALERLAFRFSDGVVTQTRAMHKALSGGDEKSDKRVFSLPNNAPKVEGATEKPVAPPYHCVVTGMFDRAKNLPLVIRAFQGFDRNRFKLSIIGDGPALLDARALVGKLEVKNVTFTGWVEDVRPYLESAHILIHPSFNEGMPNAVLEGLGYHLSVFASDTPELRELLQGEELLFNPRDPEELQARLEQYRDDPTFRSSVQEMCEKRREELTFDWNSKAYELLLNSVE